MLIRLLIVLCWNRFDVTVYVYFVLLAKSSRKLIYLFSLLPRLIYDTYHQQDYIRCFSFDHYHHDYSVTSSNFVGIFCIVFAVTFISWDERVTSEIFDFIHSEVVIYLLAVSSNSTFHINILILAIVEPWHSHTAILVSLWWKSFRWMEEPMSYLWRVYTNHTLHKC